ncbi:MAG: ImmA/IrrE family metallo-endopeptidase [Zoogloeaceae bacterium]|jgi:hypothetical protein|nr:ImmA/IrrE family metallo-endopeptidase [Zoogloeaceae bacterium]
MTQIDFVVPPRSKENIYAVASGVRNIFKYDGTKVPMGMVYEVLPHLGNFFPKKTFPFLHGIRFEVCHQHEMGDDHGQTIPELKLIRLREDVYDGMCQGNGRDRFTGAHELGHLFLHRTAGFSRVAPNSNTKLYCKSEWQANTFASAFLIDEALLPQFRSAEEVQDAFGVSKSAAEARIKACSQKK